jgi:catechol 2,3-dioxygenase-like lactoylglutathione lyase family enzyme
MAAGKKAKKGKKAARKARKAEKKAAKKAAKKLAKEARRAAKVAAANPAPARPVEAPVTKAPARKARARKVKAPAPKARKRVVRKRVVRREPARPALKDRQKPESLRLRSAGPSFTVNDIQRSLAFYRDVLGFTVKDRWEENGELRGVELLAGSVRFWLGQDDWKKGRDRAKGQGFRMYCGTAQDIDGLAERLRAAGWPLAEEPNDKPWGGRDFAFADPDGFLITIASGL